MANLPGSFNTQGTEKMNDFSTIPAGEYLASVVKSDVVLTKKAKEANNPNLGQLLKLQWKVLAGKYKGKILFTQINIVNENQQAVEIGEKEFATIRDALGVNNVTQTEQLHGIPALLTVGIESSANYPDKNVINFYKKADGADIPVDADTGGAAGDAPKKRPWD